MDRIKRWASGRQGACSGVLAAALLWAGASSGLLSPAEALLWTLLLLPASAVAVAVVAAIWDGTSPKAPRFTKAQPPSASKQFREDPNAAILVDRGGFLFAKRWFFVGTGCPPVRLLPELVDRARQGSAAEPFLVAYTPSRRFWWYQDRWFWENQDLGARDVLALLRERDRKQTRSLQRAHAQLGVEEGRAAPVPRQRSAIPREVKHAVFTRDCGRCVECHSDFDLQYDHVIPFSLGGADTAQNLQLLCSSCNQRKGASL